MTDPLVPLDMKKLEALADERGMTLGMLMKIAGVKRLGVEILASEKARLWEVLSPDGKFAEIKNGFPEALVWKVTDMSAGGEDGGGFAPGTGAGGGGFIPGAGGGG